MSLSGKFDEVRSGFGAVDHEAERVHFRIRRRQTCAAVWVQQHSVGRAEPLARVFRRISLMISRVDFVIHDPVQGNLYVVEILRQCREVDLVAQIHLDVRCDDRVTRDPRGDGERSLVARGDNFLGMPEQVFPAQDDAQLRGIDSRPHGLRLGDAAGAV